MTTIRKLLFGSALTAILIGSQSGQCQAPGTNEPPKTSQGSQSQLGFRDSNYLRRAAEANLIGARIAQLASQKGGSQQIKQLGQTLEQSHNSGFQQLTQIAQSKGVSIPKDLNTRQKRVFDHFASMSGTNFDRAVLRYLVRSEESAVRATENEANKGSDSALKEFASKSLPGLQSDLQKARTLYAGGQTTTSEPAGAQSKPQQPAPTQNKQTQ